MLPDGHGLSVVGHRESTLREMGTPYSNSVQQSSLIPSGEAGAFVSPCPYKSAFTCVSISNPNKHIVILKWICMNMFLV